MQLDLPFVDTIPIRMHEELKEYVLSLEATRRDLWSANEELRKKILSLEGGQSDLLDDLEALKALLDLYHKKSLEVPGVGIEPNP